MDRWFLPRLPRAGRTTSTLLFAIFTHVKLGQKQWSFNTYKSSVNTYHSVRTFHGKLEKISSIAPRRRWSAVLLDTAHNTQTSTKHKQSPVTASKKQHHTKQHTFVLAKVEHVTEYTTWSEPHDPQQNRVGGSLNKKGAWIANFSQASSYNSYAFDWDFWVLGHWNVAWNLSIRIKSRSITSTYHHHSLIDRRFVKFVCSRRAFYLWIQKTLPVRATYYYSSFLLLL